MKSVVPVFGLLAALMAAPLSQAASAAPPDDTSRVILITLDGMRWQDVFRGPDPILVKDNHYTPEDMQDDVKAAWFDVPDRGAALMPFLHEVMGKQGVLWGDRDHGQCMRVANDMWFSYPGYNEILTGKPDNAITYNDQTPNKNVTFLEWLNHRPDFAGKVEAVGTWDVFPYIMNDKRSGLPVNVGLQGRYPTDTLTARLGLEMLRQDKPRAIFIGFGDTDELAHAGEYDQYLAAANRADDFIRQVWELVQADPAYRGHTTLIVSTDHGRGNRADETWKEHSSKTYLQMNPDYLSAYTKTGIEGSDAIWFAAIGPGVKRAAVPGDAPCWLQSEIAASALTALGVDWRQFDAKAGKPLPPFEAGK